jgi:hypothetical protein
VSDESFVTPVPTLLNGEPVSGLPNTSLDEERREIVASVMGALAGNSPDPDEMAACGYLLWHVADTAGKPANAA